MTTPEGRPLNPSQNPEANWILGKGERDGFPMIIRMASAWSALAPVAGYDHHLIVSVRFQKPQPNGFPSFEEGDQLESLEMSLCRLLEAENESLCVLVISNNGLRDFIFYTQNPNGLGRKLKENASLFHGFVVEFALEPARGWEIYKAFSGMLSSGSSEKTVH